MDANNITKAYAVMAQVDPMAAKAAMVRDGNYWIVVQQLHVSMALHAKCMELANNMANSPMLSIRS